MPLTNCPCGCGWTTHVIFNRYSVAELNELARRDQTRAQTTKAIGAGWLIRPDFCEECGVGGLIEAHHDDYSKPLAVRWLCRVCHASADIDRRRQERVADRRGLTLLAS